MDSGVEKGLKVAFSCVLYTEHRVTRPAADLCEVF